MHVTRTKLLSTCCVAVAAFAATTDISSAKPQVRLLAGGKLTRNYTVTRNRVLRVNTLVTLAKGKTVLLNGGAMELNNQIEVTNGAMLSVAAGELRGRGRLVVHPGGTLRLTGPKLKRLAGVQIENAGTIQWGGGGRIECGNGTMVKNTGTMYLSNGGDKEDIYATTTAKFENRGFIIDISQGKGATLHGSLQNYGRILLNEKAAPRTAAARPRKGHGHGHDNDGDPQPTPTLVIITGTFGTAGSTFQTTIRSDYYGQLCVYGPVAITSGTLKYVLSPSGYVPPNANIYSIIVATSIGGNPGDFSAFVPTNFRFDRQKVPTNAPTTYQLYSYN